MGENVQDDLLGALIKQANYRRKERPVVHHSNGAERLAEAQEKLAREERKNRDREASR